MDEFSASYKHHLKILTILAVITILTISMLEYKTKNVNICIDNKKTTVWTFKSTVGELLDKEEIAFPEGGYMNLKSSDRLEDNTTIIIKTPKTYSLKLAEKVFEVESTENKVGEVLKDLNIELSDNDYTIPDINKKVNPLDNIEVVKMEETVATIKDEIPFENIQRKTNKLAKGTTQVLQDGHNGVKEIKIKKTIKNGKLIDEKIVEEEILTKPIAKIVEVGTKDMYIASRGNFRFKNSFTVTATAYDLSYASCGKYPGEKGYGITASGTKARPGTVSVDPRIIPLGTELYVESIDDTPDYGFAIAEDTGGAIKGNRIDLFFTSGKACRQFGRRKVKVYILE